MQNTIPNSLGPSITTSDRQRVEDLVIKIFSSLRSDKGVSPTDILDTYMLALNGLPMNALRSVVYKILCGTLDAKLKFVPLPPELANYVRAEASLIRRINAPLAIPGPSKPAMVNLMEKRWSDGQVLERNVSMHEFRTKAKTGGYPAGAIHVAILDRVYAAPNPEFYGDKATGRAADIIARVREQQLEAQ